MKVSNAKPATISEYISKFPAGTQRLLKKLRTTIHRAAPDAVETISYAMPAFKQRRILVYFAAYERHIGFYPGAAAIKKFASKLRAYKTSKGAIQLPLDRPISEKLVTEIVRFRVKQEMIKAAKRRP